MSDLISLGQWQGFFRYGPEYGNLEDAEAEFRLFVENVQDGQFTGRIIDWNGTGANGEVAMVTGYVNDDFISFTKQYHHFHIIDDFGNTEELPDQPGHLVDYEGYYNYKTSSFVGTWAIVMVVAHTPEMTQELTMTGTWHMHVPNIYHTS